MIRSIILAAVSAISDDPDVQRRIDHAPIQVHKLIERRAGCNYFASEYPYNEERARDLASQMRSLRCAMLERNERALRRRYVNRPDILKLLTDSQDVTY